jgi:Uma2 family endonuclease
MTAAEKLQLVSIEDYLAGELCSSLKHEYLGGFVYAMAGARNIHNSIAINTIAALHRALRGQPCRPFNSDTKIRIQLPTHVRFYYPDASVVCRPNPPDQSYQDEPVLLVEVLSKATRRIDQGEKQEAYLTLPSLSVYLLIEQDFPAVVALRRTKSGFIREVYEGLDAVVPLGEIGTELRLADIYEDVTFVPEEVPEE